MLIAISSCYDWEKNGFNDAQRRTWLPDVKAFPELEYKFFFGRGQGAEAVSLWSPGRDWIFMPDVQDDTAHLTYKTQSSLRYAHEMGFDYVFRAFPDTYCRVDRLMACAFHDYDYYGDFRHRLAWPGYASGGAGYWLSRKACRLLIDAPILGVGRDDVLMRVEDMWVGQSIAGSRFDDQRFKNTRDDCPAKDNDFVTAHLSYIWRDGKRDGELKAEPYNPAEMFAAHEAWKR